MLLQTKYRWYKLILYIIILSILGLGIGSGVYLVKGKNYERDVNKKVIEINKLKEKIDSITDLDDSYKIYKLGDVIYKNQNKVNYVALYEYLNQVKKYILKNVKKYTISRLILSVKPHEVDLDTTLPNYNVIYLSGGLVDLLSKGPFIEKIHVNNFRKLQNGINVKLKIKTK